MKTIPFIGLTNGSNKRYYVVRKAIDLNKNASTPLLCSSPQPTLPSARQTNSKQLVMPSTAVNRYSRSQVNSSMNNKIKRPAETLALSHAEGFQINRPLLTPLQCTSHKKRFSNMSYFDKFHREKDSTPDNKVSKIQRSEGILAESEEMEQKYLAIIENIKLFKGLKGELMINFGICRWLYFLELANQLNKENQSSHNKSLQLILDDLTEKVLSKAQISTIGEFENILSKIITLNRGIIRGIGNKESGRETAFGFDRICVLNILLMERYIISEKNKCKQEWKDILEGIQHKFNGYETMLADAMKRWHLAESIHTDNIKKLARKIESMQRENVRISLL